MLLARSDDLTRWVPEDRAAAGMPEDQALTDVRDPFLFEAGGRRYAVQGAGSPHGPPCLLVYDATDLTDWTLLGTLLDGDDPVAAEHAPANVWECPNLVRLGDRWLIVLSLWRLVDGRHDLAGVRYLVGDLRLEDGRAPRFVPEAGGRVDTGPTFYAPQLLAHDGRVLLRAWSWEHGRSDAEIDAAGWAGVLTFPRALTLRGDALVSARAHRPAARSARRRARRPVRVRGVRGRARRPVVVRGGAGRHAPAARRRVPGRGVPRRRPVPDHPRLPRTGSRWRLNVRGPVTAWSLGRP